MSMASVARGAGDDVRRTAVSPRPKGRGRLVHSLYALGCSFTGVHSH